MRICEFVLAPAIGGAEILALELATELRDRGHRVEMAALDYADRAGIRTLGDDFATVKPSSWAAGKRLRRLSTSRRTISRGSYDVVHSHTFLPNLYVRAAAATSRARAPIVVTLHSGSDDFARRVPRLVERVLASRTAAIVAVSPTQREQFAEYFPEHAERILLIPNGVRKLPSAPGPVADRPRDFAVVGRIVPDKGLETVIRGFSLFASEVRDPELRLHVIGPETDPAVAQTLREIASSLPGDPRIVFHGPVLNPLDQRRVDVLVHGSIREAHPVTILEAAGRRIPIVCTRSPRISGVIAERCTTFAPDDADGLRRGLVDVYRRWPAALDVAAEAWLTVPDIRDCASAYERLFGELLRSG